MDTNNPLLEEDDDAFLASLDELLGEKPKPEEPPEDGQPPLPNESKKNKRLKASHAKAPKPSKKMLTVLALCLVAAAVLAIALPAFLRAADPYGGKIAPGVRVGAVDLSDLSKGEAKKVLTAFYGSRYAQDSLVVSFPELSSILSGVGEQEYDSLTLSPKDTGAHLDAGAAVHAAYALGREDLREDKNLPLLPYLHLKEEVLQSSIQSFQSQLEGLYRADSSEIQPDSVTVTRGYPAVTIDTDRLYQQMLDAYENGTLSDCNYDGSVTLRQPEGVDLEALWQQTRVEPKEPQVDTSTYLVIPGEDGREFDLDAAKAQYDNLPYGQRLDLPLESTHPEISDEDAWFQDTLGHCETPHSNNENRNSNLKKACEMLNGLVLQPGQEFSYNETLGERTKDKGWLPAPAYSGTTLVDSPGGGICQVSSTLYLASVYAELTVLERVNHGFPVSYIPLGMDATVNWGFTDLKLRNDTPMPVKILAEETDDLVKVSILGTETRNYDIKMTYSVGGRHVKTYMSKYDKTTGELISKEPVALSSYLEDIYK